MRMAYYRCSLCGLPSRREGLCAGCEAHSQRLVSRHCSSCGIGTCDDGKSRCGKCETPEPMTLERACKILNDRQHDCQPWSRSSPPGVLWKATENLYGYQGPGLYRYKKNTKGAWYPTGHLTRFEAIAIAEKYERDRNS